MNRHGLSLISDLFWIIVFIVVAILLYAFLYAPIQQEVLNVKSSATSEPLAGNAQYIANSLLFHQAAAGTTESAQATFADSIVSLAGAYNSELLSLPGYTSGLNWTAAAAVIGIDLSDLETIHAESSYAATLDTIFKPESYFWKNQAGTNDRLYRITIQLQDPATQEVLPYTCHSYSREGKRSSCEGLNAVQKASLARKQTVGGQAANLPSNVMTESGIAFIPTQKDSIALNVTMEWFSS